MTREPPPAELLSFREVASILGVGKDYVYARVDQGDLQAIQLGTDKQSRRRIRRRDLEAFIEERTIPLR